MRFLSKWIGAAAVAAAFAAATPASADVTVTYTGCSSGTSSSSAVSCPSGSGGPVFSISGCTAASGSGDSVACTISSGTTTTPSCTVTSGTVSSSTTSSSVTFTGSCVNPTATGTWTITAGSDSSAITTTCDTTTPSTTCTVTSTKTQTVTAKYTSTNTDSPASASKSAALTLTTTTGSIPSSCTLTYYNSGSLTPLSATLKTIAINSGNPVSLGGLAYDVPGFAAGNVAIAKLVVPASGSSISYSEYAGPATTRTVYASQDPCGLTQANKITSSTTGAFKLRISATNTVSGVSKGSVYMKPGETWYFMWINYGVDPNYTLSTYGYPIAPATCSRTDSIACEIRVSTF